MTIFQAVILGIIQGLTEFLPVSSSGHLVIFQHIFGINEAPLVLDVLLHIGTLIAVFVCFWEDIESILRKPFSKLTLLLIIGCIPAGLMGYFLEPYFEKAFQSLLTVGLGLIFTGFILKISELVSNSAFRYKDEEDSTIKDALLIGILQGIAILPGVSRSGSTIAGALIMGMEREFAARFSFLLSIPVILGAGVLQLKDLTSVSINSELWITYLTGMVVAAICGYIAIKMVVGLVKKGKFSVFSYYCWALGCLVIIGSFFF